MLKFAEYSLIDPLQEQRRATSQSGVTTSRASRKPPAALHCNSLLPLLPPALTWPDHRSQLNTATKLVPAQRHSPLRNRATACKCRRKPQASHGPPPSQARMTVHSHSRCYLAKIFLLHEMMMMMEDNTRTTSNTPYYWTALYALTFNINIFNSEIFKDLKCSISRFVADIQSPWLKLKQRITSKNLFRKMDPQLYCLRWNNHQSNLLSVFDHLLQVILTSNINVYWLKQCVCLSLKPFVMWHWRWTEPPWNVTRWSLPPARTISKTFSWTILANIRSCF